MYDFYDEKRSKKEIGSSPYTALSLCYNILAERNYNRYLTNLKKGEMWFKNMLEKNPKNVGFMMGYANILACLSSYDEAIKIYE